MYVPKRRTAMKKRNLSDGVFVGEGRRWLWYLSLLFLALGLFALCEVLISEEACHEMYLPLDDLIPFFEGFVVFYVLWYFMVVGSILWFALYSRESFRGLILFMAVCQISAVVIFLVYPNKQMLRPEVMPRDNVFARVVFAIHSVDTNTNVCPSMHVAWSVALASVWGKERGVRLIFKIFIGLLCLLVCLSTVFIKQHSVIDVFAALILCAAVEFLIYGRFWKNYLQTGRL
jgi:membrane-associated phospholipid phosphatase